MSFSILQISENGLDLVRLREDSSGTEAEVLPSFGALLHAFKIRMGTSLFNVIDHYDSLDQLKKQLDTSYKSSKLSPFPCRIGEGKYTHAGNRYEFLNKFIDGSAIHGLLYNKSFSILEQHAGNDSAFLLLNYEYRKDDDQYPFDYTCRVAYTLFTEGVLQVETTVTNKSKVPIPMADGWHPYFRLGGKVDEWLMYFNAASMVEFDKQLLPTGRLLHYDHFNVPMTIGPMELDNCFLIRHKTGEPVCELFNPFNKLKVSFIPGSTYPYLQIYTPPHRQSIAIENLSSAPDSFNNKMGLTILEPGDSQSFDLQYRLSMV
jgi:aldose 1-epimerase